MPNSDTWPRGVSVETISNMDTARSCDSVISNNSVCSEDSMEHLSAEEKACLMYLEETIESLDLQEDSGFSNDEPDPANLRRKHGGSETMPETSNIVHLLVERGKTEASGESANPDPQTSAPDFSDVPNHIPPDPTHALPEPTSGSTTPVPAPHSSELSLSTDVDPQSDAAKAELSVKPEMNLSFIPPPSDFMDEPEPSLSPHTDSAVSSPVSKPTIMLQVLRQRVSVKNKPTSTPSSPSPLGSAPENSAPVSPASSSPVSPSLTSPSLTSPTLPSLILSSSSLRSPSLPSPSLPSPSLSSQCLTSPIPASPSFAPQEKLAAELSSPPSSHPSSPQTVAPPGPSEPKSPPAVAPKPKRLPPNIILKAHKSTGHESSMGHLSPSPTGLMNPQKVHMEALRKLGLLKSEECDSIPAPKSLQTRRSWASSPLSPASPKSAAPSVPFVHTLAPAQTPSRHVPSEPLPDIIPVPAAFSDDGFAGDSPLLNKKLPSSAGGGMKSATLERSGMGLSSYMASLEQDKQTLGQLRNNRPRPASLGSRKDFSSAEGVAIAGGVASTQVDSGKPGPYASQHSDNSQKLPRSQGISVLICPRGQSEEARREALKKLGLLRD